MRPASTTPASWDAFSDVDAFVEEVLVELTAMAADGTIGDLGYRGERLAKAAEAFGIPVRPIARGRAGLFIPTEIACMVERSFNGISRYRRLNTIVERTKEHLVAFVQIAFISILSRRLQRLASQQVSA